MVIQGNVCDGQQVLHLSGLFEEHRDRMWYFVQPGGNWGDYLIYAGAEALARRLRLKWTTLDYRNFDPTDIPAGAAIYLHGSGGFNPWGSRRAFSNLERALSVTGALVVQGPQTAEIGSPETKELLVDACKDRRAEAVHFFARERNTFAFLNDALPADMRIHLDHDTALHLTPSDILALADLRSLPDGRYTLFVSRADDEAPASEPTEEGDLAVMDPAYFAVDFKHWIRIHAFARRIITNRLHSSIVGSLLGKPVVLMAGSYHKNRSIWEQSLRERGVEWREEQVWLQSLVKKSARSSLADMLSRSHSWKLQRAAMWIRGVPLR